MMDRTLHILLVGSDRTLEDEFRIALSGVPDRRAVLFYAPTYRDGLDVARDRQPNLVVVQIERDVHELEGFAKELQPLVPGVILAAAFQPDRLAHGDSESAIIIDLLRAQVRDFLRRPLSTTELRQVLDRLFSKPSATAARKGRLVSFVGNKGGVGKSTLSVNVATVLAARHPGQVLLVDTSLQLGVCALMLDLEPTTTIVDAIRERERLDETLLRRLTLAHSSGLRLLAAPADALEAAEIGDEAIARVLNLARRAFDYVIVDTFPMLDRVVLAILDLSDRIFVVFQGTAPSVAGAARLLPVLEGLGVPAERQRVILNLNHKRFLGSFTSADIERRLERPLDYVVPYDTQVLVSMNTGSPYILRAARWRGFARAVSQIANSFDGLDGQATTADARRTVAQPEARDFSERRRDVDRRMRDMGWPEGDRRSGSDRRANRPVAVDLEKTL
jgi:pilus assembly protein CpaE